MVKPGILQRVKAPPSRAGKERQRFQLDVTLLSVRGGLANQPVAVQLQRGVRTSTSRTFVNDGANDGATLVNQTLSIVCSLYRDRHAGRFDKKDAKLRLLAAGRGGGGAGGDDGKPNTARALAKVHFNVVDFLGELGELGGGGGCDDDVARREVFRMSAGVDIVADVLLTRLDSASSSTTPRASLSHSESSIAHDIDNDDNDHDSAVALDVAAERLSLCARSEASAGSFQSSIWDDATSESEWLRAAASRRSLESAADSDDDKNGRERGVESGAADTAPRNEASATDDADATADAAARTAAVPTGTTSFSAAPLSATDAADAAHTPEAQMAQLRRENHNLRQVALKAQRDSDHFFDVAESAERRLGDTAAAAGSAATGLSALAQALSGLDARRAHNVAAVEAAHVPDLRQYATAGGMGAFTSSWQALCGQVRELAAQWDEVARETQTASGAGGDFDGDEGVRVEERAEGEVRGQEEAAAVGMRAASVACEALMARQRVLVEMLGALFDDDDDEEEEEEDGEESAAAAAAADGADGEKTCDSGRGDHGMDGRSMAAGCASASATADARRDAGSRADTDRDRGASSLALQLRRMTTQALRIERKLRALNARRARARRLVLVAGAEARALRDALPSLRAHVQQAQAVQREEHEHLRRRLDTWRAAVTVRGGDDDCDEHGHARERHRVWRHRVSLVAEQSRCLRADYACVQREVRARLDAWRETFAATVSNAAARLERASSLPSLSSSITLLRRQRRRQKGGGGEEKEQERARGRYDDNDDDMDVNAHDHHRAEQNARRVEQLEKEVHALHARLSQCRCEAHGADEAGAADGAPTVDVLRQLITAKMAVAEAEEREERLRREFRLYRQRQR